jgi:hypothetical protein
VFKLVVLLLFFNPVIDLVDDDDARKRFSSVLFGRGFEAKQSNKQHKASKTTV